MAQLFEYTKNTALYILKGCIYGMWTRSQFLKTYMMPYLLGNSMPQSLRTVSSSVSENQATSLLTLYDRGNNCFTGCLR